METDAYADDCEHWTLDDRPTLSLSLSLSIDPSLFLYLSLFG